MDELVAALAKGGKKLSRSEVEDIVKLVDKNNDGEVCTMILMSHVSLRCLLTLACSAPA